MIESFNDAVCPQCLKDLGASFETFKEEVSWTNDDDGVAKISYFGRCRVCKTSKEADFTINILPYPDMLPGW